MIVDLIDAADLSPDQLALAVRRGAESLRCLDQVPQAAPVSARRAQSDRAEFAAGLHRSRSNTCPRSRQATQYAAVVLTR